MVYSYYPLVLFLCSGFGIFGFLIGNILERFFGFQGCFLCHTERFILLAAGSLSFLGFIWYRANIGRLWTIGAAFLFATCSVVSFYHAGVQYKILDTPRFCKVSQTVGKTLDEQFENFLSQPKVSCDQRTLDIFGIPASLYLGFSCFIIMLFYIMIIQRMKKERFY